MKNCMTAIHPSSSILRRNALFAYSVFVINYDIRPDLIVKEVMLGFFLLLSIEFVSFRLS